MSIFTNFAFYTPLIFIIFSVHHCTTFSSHIFNISLDILAYLILFSLYYTPSYFTSTLLKIFEAPLPFPKLPPYGKRSGNTPSVLPNLFLCLPL